VGKITVFNFVTLNGFFEGPKHDTSWAHARDESGYAAEMLARGDTLLFGRKTYELMAGYWPTPAAEENSPTVANGMNAAPKIVFSRTLKHADWNNTRVVRDDIVDATQKMKAADENMTLLGSGSIVTLFTQVGLVDEYQLMVHPLALGGGTPFLKGLKNGLDLKLIATRNFNSGNVLLRYQPAAAAARPQASDFEFETALTS
jgi:dihydrofolate reductase